MNRLRTLCCIFVLIIVNILSAQDSATVDLSLTFEIVSDNGGQANRSDFTATIYANPQSANENNSFSNLDSPLVPYDDNLDLQVIDTQVDRLEVESAVLPTGPYSIIFAPKTDRAKPYNITYSQGCSGVAESEAVQCIVTADDRPVTLAVYKFVEGNESGFAPSDFTMVVHQANINDPDSHYQTLFAGSSEGEILELQPTRFYVSERAETAVGFGVHMSDDCDIQRKPEVGENFICVITNTFTGTHFFKGLGLQLDCTGLIDWTPARIDFSVVETPGTDGPIEMHVANDLFIFHSDTWAFDYGQIILQRLGKGRFGIRTTGLLDRSSDQVIVFPDNSYHEWRVAVLASDLVIGRYDAYLQGNCLASLYFAITPNQLSSTQLFQKLNLVASWLDVDYSELTLEEVAFALNLTLRDLYSSATIGEEAQIIALTPFDETWRERVSWLARQEIPDDGLPEPRINYYPSTTNLPTDVEDYRQQQANTPNDTTNENPSDIEDIVDEFRDDPALPEDTTKDDAGVQQFIENWRQQSNSD